ncbi:hypothetical protein BH11ARM1_BH11ARM1_17780 [soil metagenome]
MALFVDLLKVSLLQQAGVPFTSSEFRVASFECSDMHLMGLSVAHTLMARETEKSTSKILVSFGPLK